MMKVQFSTGKIYNFVNECNITLQLKSITKYFMCARQLTL